MAKATEIERRAGSSSGWTWASQTSTLRRRCSTPSPRRSTHTRHTTRWAVGSPSCSRRSGATSRGDTAIKDAAENQLIVTPGGRFAVYSALATVASEGDSVVVIEPNWPAYKEGLDYIGARAMTIRTTLEDEWEPSPESVKAAIKPNTKAIVLSYPVQPHRQDNGQGDFQGDSRDRGRRGPHRDERRDLQRLRLQAVPDDPREPPAEVHPHVLVLQGMEHDRVQGGILASPPRRRARRC